MLKTTFMIFFPKHSLILLGLKIREQTAHF